MSHEAKLSANLEHQLDEWAHTCRGLWAAWESFALALARDAREGSIAHADFTAFAAKHPDANPRIGHAAGRWGSRYVAGMGAHLLGLAALLEQRELRLSVWAVVRAELELAGRAAWLIGPDIDSSCPSDTRAARFLMEALADARRHERAARSRKDADARRALKKAVQRVEADIDVTFPGHASLVGIPEDIDNPDWELSGEKAVGLSAGVKLFAHVAFDGAPGLYDSFSRLAHPSFVTLEKLAPTSKREQTVVSDYVTSEEQVVELVRLACLSFYKAAHLVAGYFLIDDSPLEEWAKESPANWFTGDPVE